MDEKLKEQIESWLECVYEYYSEDNEVEYSADDFILDAQDIFEKLLGIDSDDDE